MIIPPKICLNVTILQELEGIYSSIVYILFWIIRDVIKFQSLSVAAARITIGNLKPVCCDTQALALQAARHIRMWGKKLNYTIELSATLFLMLIVKIVNSEQ